MIRFRVKDIRDSGRWRELGYCDNDPRLPGVAYTAQSRLLNCKEAGDEGWLGSFAEMAFTVDRTHPYLTTPREVARIEAVNVCTRPIELNNQFFEYLQFGNGRMPKRRGHCGPRLTEAYMRNIVPTFVDIGPVPQFIQIFATDPADVTNSKRVFLQGTDANGVTVYTMDGTPPVQVMGEYDVLTSPFTVSPTTWGSITGVQKDVTQGPVRFDKVDPTTGESVTILTMEPSEQVAAYRRYFFHPVPRNCCGTVTNPQSVSVTAICALEPLPLVADTDYLLLQGDGAIEALFEESQAVRYGSMDTPTGKQMSRERHNMAVQILNGVISRYMGLDTPAVQFAPFGSARLRYAGVGMI